MININIIYFRGDAYTKYIQNLYHYVRLKQISQFESIKYCIRIGNEYFGSEWDVITKRPCKIGLSSRAFGK